MKSEPSPASPLVQEIREFRLQCLFLVGDKPCPESYGAEAFGAWCNHCLLRLLTAEYETLQQRAIGELDAANQHVKIVQEQRDDSARTVRSIAVMLGWGNVPPRETLEADIRALKARLEAAEARAEAAEARLAQPARTGCDDCLDARKAAEARAEAAEAGTGPKSFDDSAPVDAQGLVDAMRKNGVDPRVVAEAYGWTIAVDGELHGLTAGDMFYEPSGLHLDHFTLEWLRELEAKASSATTERGDEASGQGNHNGLNDQGEKENTNVARSEGTRE